MSTQNQPIHTFARIKPLFMGEEKIFLRKNICTVLTKNQDQYGFDGVFDAESSNQEVYNQTTRKIIQHSFQGFNSCIMAYGQTSSGKTHTMKGSQSNPGIIPLCLRDIFQKIQNENLEALVKISYMEIYNQDIIDLLAESENKIIEPREDQKKNLTLTGLKQPDVKSIYAAMQLFQKGEDRRKFASNNLNLNSSRSHAIFRINLRVCDDDLNQTSSQINLVDLAGSQGIERTKAEKISKIQGENINKSILALTKVIKTMSERDQQWINFRDSKLTRILQKSLCQNSKSTIICMINPTMQNYQESVNTLKFGQMAAKIKVEVRQNMIRSEEIKKQQTNYTNLQFLPSQKIQLEQARGKIKNYEDEINYLRRINKELEQANYMKEESIMMFEKHCQDMGKQLEDMRATHDQNLMEWWRQKQALKNGVDYYKEEVDKLGRINEEIQSEKRTLQKNEKALVQNLQYYQNQCRHLNSEILNIKARIDQENSKTFKTTMFSNTKPTKITKNKPNLFQLPPYKEQTDRLSPSKLSWIVQLKIQVIDLGRQVNEFTKANIQIAQESEQLRRKIDEYEENVSKERSSGKINPEALEYNEIKKLNNKIKNLKTDLKRSQDRQRKNRQILKKQSHRNLIQMEEFEQWYTKKYNSNFFIQNSVQTESTEEEKNVRETIELKFDSKKMEVENCRSEKDFHLTPQKHNLSLLSNINPIKGLVLSKNKPLIQSENPQNNRKEKEEKEVFLLDQHEFSPDKNIDINIKGPNNNIQVATRSIKSRETFLLDNLTSNNVTSSYQDNFKNFITFEEGIRSKRYSKSKERQQALMPNSKKHKIQGNLISECPNSSTNMVPEEEKEVQI